ncbi:MAG: molecular chaperone DnaJ [Synechococcaceae cyanobacterium ELA445]
MGSTLIRLKAKPAYRQAAPDNSRGFGGSASGKGKAASGKANGGKGRKRKGSGLPASDRTPLGKCPDLDAIEARQRLGLALAGRLSAEQVTRAWKLAAGEHHPDRGGAHTAMTAINGARDVLLGRGLA